MTFWLSYSITILWLHTAVLNRSVANGIGDESRLPPGHHCLYWVSDTIDIEAPVSSSMHIFTSSTKTGTLIGGRFIALRDPKSILQSELGQQLLPEYPTLTDLSVILSSVSP